MNLEPVSLRVSGRPVFAVQPDVSTLGRLSVDVLATANRARAAGAAVCLLPSPGEAASVLHALSFADVPMVVPSGWLRACWRGAAVSRQVAEKLAHARRTFWLEWQKEMRRHAGDERLPLALRVRLRDAASRASVRSVPARDVLATSRQWLREPVSVSLTRPAAEAVSRSAKAAGIDVDRPLVVIDVRARSDRMAAAAAWLDEQGWRTIHMSPDGDAAFELFLLLSARFVVTDALDTQRAAYLTNTPSLLLDARDAFDAYPVRPDCLFTLAAAIDLESGRELEPLACLELSSQRRLRHCGFRANTAAEVLDAVREMHAGVTSGSTEHESQRRFRAAVAAAAGDQARDLVGSGRLVRWQSDRITQQTH